MAAIIEPGQQPPLAERGKQYLLDRLADELRVARLRDALVGSDLHRWRQPMARNSRVDGY